MDQQLKNKLQDYKPSLSAGVWDGIAAGIGPPPKIPFWKKWWFITSVITLSILTLLLFTISSVGVEQPIGYREREFSTRSNFIIGNSHSYLSG